MQFCVMLSDVFVFSFEDFCDKSVNFVGLAQLWMTTFYFHCCKKRSWLITLVQPLKLRNSDHIPLLFSVSSYFKDKFHTVVSFSFRYH